MSHNLFMRMLSSRTTPAVIDWQQQVCRVCELLDKDTTLKDCTYCDTCSAWICRNDLNNWARRGKAALGNMAGKISHVARSCCGKK